MPDIREKNRKRPPLTKKQMMFQMLLCVGILAFFALQDAFFPSGDKKASPSPTASVQVVAQSSGSEPLTAEMVGTLTENLPELSGEWKLYIQPGGGYVLLSPNVEASGDAKTFGGYELGQSVKARLTDQQALGALAYRIPAGGTMTIANADGQAVDTATFASVADTVRKNGFKDVKLAATEPAQ